MTLTGPGACTVFCGTADPAVVVATLREHGTFDEPSPDWSRIVLSGTAGSPGTVAFSRLMFAPSSKFSDIVLGAHTAFRAGAEVRPGGLAEVTGLLETTDMILGVVFDPPLADDDARRDAVHAVATATRGLIFDADVMLDAAGEPLATI